MKKRTLCTWLFALCMAIFLASVTTLAAAPAADRSDTITGYKSDGAVSTLNTALHNPLIGNSLHSHCICGGTTDIGDHTTHADITWTAWTSTDSLPTTAGSYYLVNNVTLTYDLKTTFEWKVKENISICLNGKTISTNGTFAKVQGSGVLSVTDCGKGGGKIIGGSDYFEMPEIGFRGRIPVMYCQEASTFNLYGGAILMNEGAKASDNEIVELYAAWDSPTFNIYGGSLGEISHIGTEAEGRYLYANSKSNFNAYGGAIYGPVHFGFRTQCKFGNTAFATHVRHRKDYSQDFSGTVPTNFIGDARMVWEYTLMILVNGTQIRVDDLNKNDILGDGSGSLKYAFDEDSQKNSSGIFDDDFGHGTLTFNNATLIYDADCAADVIKIGRFTLDIVLIGENVIKPDDDNSAGGAVIAVERTLAISGNGSLEIVSKRDKCMDLNYYGVVLGNPDLLIVTSTKSDGAGAVITDVNDGGALSAAKYMKITPPHTHCICGGTTDFDGHKTHAKTTLWQPWTAADSLPATAGNYYLVNDVIIPSDSIILPNGINICLNGKKISNGKELAVYIETTIADGGTFSVTDCGTAGGIGNISMSGGRLVMYGGSIMKSTALKIDKDASFLMTGNARNDYVVMIRGNADFTMSGNAKNNGRLFLFETDEKAAVKFCDRADGGSIIIYQPKQGAKISICDKAKIAELDTSTLCTLGLIMQNDAEIGMVKNLVFESPELSGNAKLGSQNSTFGISTPTDGTYTFALGDNVELIGTVTITNKTATNLIFKDNASVKGSLIISNSASGALFGIQNDDAIQGDLKCEGTAVDIVVANANIDGDIDTGDSRMTGKHLTCRGTIKSGIFECDVVNNGSITGGIFYGNVTGTGTIEESAKVDVAFDTNGGSSIGTLRILRGQKAAPPAAAAKAGYIFNSWQLGGNDFDFSATPIVENITLNASWTLCDHSGNTNSLSCTQETDCSVCCGKIAATGHSPEAGYKHDDTFHWITCKNCTDRLNETAHSGADDGDCTTAVYCICGYTVRAAEEHDFDNVWHSDSAKHWHECRNAGCKVTSANERHIGYDDGDCTTPVVCFCGYTIRAAETHNFSGAWHNDDYGHWRLCQNLSCIISEPRTAHSGADDGDCTTAVYCICGYVYIEANHDHILGDWKPTGNGEHYRSCTVRGCTAANIYGVCFGGKATCTDNAACILCGGSYGEKDPHNHAKPSEWTRTATTHERIYPCCGETATAEEAHTMKNGVCSECGYGCRHSGGKATCTSKAVCDICGNSYGDTDPDNHTGKIAWDCTEKTHTEKYTCCGNTAGEPEAHKWADGICKICGYECAHTGGNASCTERAICENCGSAYGETNRANHENLTKIDEVAPSGTESGTKEHWHCGDCGRNFADPEGRTELSDSELIIPGSAPTIIDGMNGKWKKGSKIPLIFRSSAPYAEFISVLVDGSAIDESCYNKREGSTVIELKPEYLETLPEGTHTLTIRSEGGDATTTFTVEKGMISPPTGDDGIWLTLIIAITAVAGMAFAVRKTKHN